MDAKYGGRREPTLPDAPEPQYRILTRADPISLAREVQRLMTDGWEPQGGVSRDQPFHAPVWSQAMVKR